MTSQKTINDMHIPSDLLSTLRSSLDAFLSSNASFQIVKTASSRLPYGNSATNVYDSGPGSLLILDSSFNPPTRAHLSMATSALREYLTSTTKSSDTASKMRRMFPPPYKILLLFAVHNADKSPSPAAFPHRLALMYMSAIDILSSLSNLPEQTYQESLDVQVGITKEPYYSDKSAAIDTSDAYGNAKENKPKHIHLIGYDTFVRFLNPKYYGKYSPPLSALDPFFEKNGLRLTLRASSPEEAREQKATLEGLARGDLEGSGGRRCWAELIEVVEGEEEVVGVSSTAIRKACQQQDWTTVDDLCPPKVAMWVKENALYQDATTGKI